MLEKMDGNNRSIVHKHYPEQNYRIMFNKKTGYFIRAEEKGYPEPLWAMHGPELLDISITNWCDKGCSFCYRKSTVKGSHMSLHDYEHIMKEAQAADVLQVALGGGNPNQHPDFIKILQKTVEYGIVPCYTTNGRGLTDEILHATKEYCGSVAISAYEPYTEFRTHLELLFQYGIKANVHFVTDSQTIDTAIEWLENPPYFLDGINSIIFLNYKPIGRNPNLSLLLKDPEKISRFYALVNEKKQAFKIGFDSCSISGVVKHVHVNTSFYEGCDAGRFSAFIDENLRMMPCSFMTNNDWFGDLKTHSLVDIWQNNQFFKKYRGNILNNGCNGCSHQSTCMGGCPFIEELSQCGWKDERLNLKYNF
ncbi:MULTISPECIES: radical SAM protein [Bacteroidota]|uniref:Radical SAM protein n=4 Tax=Chryseobacterium group TaxID=2782232 RepID=A0AAJ1R4J3_9FLAO|nr:MULTISPECIES: radical SAM/SPASM domain-containing protein [Chryseobacterium]EFK36047.1 radical SAM domain protein [Chryseobacterium gleum ATCC 35910]MDN4011513.1 radical SAM protein [Chryseobacterium gambrini]VEE11233.1 pyrroloquinoline quinone biosynthesis protein PqqE [Chryseobacterium gleum]VFA44026.1 pyrroloquinoline quinone biosynthesis protein PqqE [Chryseobacterium indologenes]